MEYLFSVLWNKITLGYVTPLDWPRSAYKDDVKVKVNDPYFQYQLRVSHDALMAQIW